jgi:hypothetical protein
MLVAIAETKSVVSHSVSGGEAMIPYLGRLLNITVNKATVPSDWKKSIVVPIYKGITYRWSQTTDPLSSNSIVCNQMVPQENLG